MTLPAGPGASPLNVGRDLQARPRSQRIKAIGIVACAYCVETLQSVEPLEIDFDQFGCRLSVDGRGREPLLKLIPFSSREA